MIAKFFTVAAVLLLSLSILFLLVLFVISVRWTVSYSAEPSLRQRDMLKALYTIGFILLGCSFVTAWFALECEIKHL